VKDFTSDLGTGGGIGREKLVVGNTFFFIALDKSEHSGGDLELWKSDGTEAGTNLVKDFSPNGNDWARKLVKLNNVLYFSAGDWIEDERELWKSDGTEAGTVALTDFLSSSTFINSDLFIFGNSLYFEDYHGGAWQSDGTAAGTTAYTGLIPFASARLFDDNGITFSWQEVFDDEYGESIEQKVISDGTTTGTISFESNRNCGGENNIWAALIGYTIICLDFSGVYFGPLAVDVNHEITYS
jgi:ELWxxDGT repeat protein